MKLIKLEYFICLFFLITISSYLGLIILEYDFFYSDGPEFALNAMKSILDSVTFLFNPSLSVEELQKLIPGEFRAPFFYWICSIGIIFGELFFGNSAKGMFVVDLLINIIEVTLFYKLIRTCLNKDIALLATVIYVASPIQVTLIGLLIRSNLSGIGTILFLYLAYIIRPENCTRIFLLTVILNFVALLTKISFPVQYIIFSIFITGYYVRQKYIHGKVFAELNQQKALVASIVVLTLFTIATAFKISSALLNHMRLSFSNPDWSLENLNFFQNFLFRFQQIIGMVHISDAIFLILISIVVASIFLVKNFQSISNDSKRVLLISAIQILCTFLIVSRAQNHDARQIYSVFPLYMFILSHLLYVTINKKIFFHIIYIVVLSQAAYLHYCKWTNEDIKIGTQLITERTSTRIYHASNKKPYKSSAKSLQQVADKICNTDQPFRILVFMSAPSNRLFEYMCLEQNYPFRIDGQNVYSVNIHLAENPQAYLQRPHSESLVYENFDYIVSYPKREMLFITSKLTQNNKNEKTMIDNLHYIQQNYSPIFTVKGNINKHRRTYVVYKKRNAN